MLNLEDIDIPSNPWPIVIGGTAVAGLVFFVLRLLILKRARNMTSAARYMMNSVLVSSISVPLTLLFIAGMILIVERLLSHTKLLPETGFTWSGGAKQVLLIAAVMVFIDRFVQGIIGRYSERSEELKNSRGIVQGISRGLVFCIGALVLLGTLGISITPLIASLGITSLAVALALQPTLENLFSGVQLVVDKPVRVGDFIELDSGEQGFVDKIGWRSTWIRMLPNNTVIMPNSELAKSKIINYFYPERELSVPVEVGVHYNSDLEHVERVTLEVAREVLVSHEWGVDDYNTFVVFTAFDSSSINFTVMLRAKEYFNRFWVKSAFIKALHKRYALEGIVIPYPIHAINTDQESATKKR